MSEEKLCGIVMPISECDGRPPTHWADVLDIISSAAKAAGFKPRLVSETFESNLIHKEILQNIYHDNLIICDVSGRNPNVFFELGIRMATQKPVIIVKDDKTSYPFDTGPNRYLEYPRDLRHPLMESFKEKLKKSLIASEHQKPEDSFIGQLGPFKIPDIENTSVSAGEAIFDRLTQIERRISRLSEKSWPQRELFNSDQFVSVSNLQNNQLQILTSEVSRDQLENGIDLVGNFDPTFKINFINNVSENELVAHASSENANSSYFRELVAETIKDAIHS